MEQSHRVWLEANGPGPWPCTFCQQPVTSLGGSRIVCRDSGIIHHHDGNHGNNAAVNLRAAHSGCHVSHHRRSIVRDCRPLNASIDLHGKMPVWRQLAGQIRDAISSGEYGPRQAIPSLKQLQGETGLAMGTIQRAIQLLEDEGLVYTVSGRGTFVSPRE